MLRAAAPCHGRAGDIAKIARMLYFRRPDGDKPLKFLSPGLQDIRKLLPATHAALDHFIISAAGAHAETDLRIDTGLTSKCSGIPS